MKHRTSQKDGPRSTRTVDEVHGFWRKPDDVNAPETYLPPRRRSEFLLQRIRSHAPPEPSVLEIGCNVGRNLDCLFQAGLRKLEAIEINPSAVVLLKRTFPEMAAAAVIHNAPVESVIKTFEDARFDVVYSMAVLEHIHYESSWIFPEIARVVKRILITLEDEGGRSPLHFPRNYREVFGPLGLQQIEETACDDVFDITGEIKKQSGSSFVCRVFRKP